MWTITSEQSIDWGLYRYFLAVADTGSLTAAARRLGVSQPTVGRQIQALEREMNSRLFVKSCNGYVPTAAGRAIVELAQGIQDNALAIERRVAREDQRLDGRVRISAAEGLATYWMPPVLAALHDCYPEIEVELIVRSAAVDLMKHEADIALRLGAPCSDDLLGRRIGQVSFGLFAQESYLASRGVPQRLADLSRHCIIESAGAIENLAQARRLREAAGAARVALSCDNLVVQFAALQAGQGVMALPLYMARRAPGLRRILSDDFDLSLDLWLLVHRDLRSLARIDAVFEFLAEAVCRDRDQFTTADGPALNRPLKARVRLSSNGFRK